MQGYGKDYQYAHDDPAGIADQQHFPDQLIGKRSGCLLDDLPTQAHAGRVFYEPTDRGYEREIKSRMAYWEEELQRKRQKT
jgi:putative ATPase